MNDYGASLGPHRGAIDQTTITSQPPPEVMKRVREALEGMGIEIQVESEYKYRCIRARRHTVVGPVGGSNAIGNKDEGSLPAPREDTDATIEDETTPKVRQVSLPDISSGGSAASFVSNIETIIPPSPTQDTVYGERSEEPGDEVRFSVELTKLDRLANTYSLDIRRVKGNLRSYRFLYVTLRERANLQR